ncbi:MAG: hypothetical protein ABIR06_04660 [Cyclobacteriaceae bacterium]
MVNLNKAKRKLEELSQFFTKVKESHDSNNVDKDSASYGFKKVEFIKSVVVMYKKKPQNKLFKQIHSGFFPLLAG